MLWRSLLLAGLIRYGTSAPHTKRWDVVLEKHSWAAIPSGWELRGPAPADHSLDVRIALKPARLDELTSSLLEISNPMHARYGAHLTKDAVDALVAPHPDSVDLVEAWLTHHNINGSHRLNGSGGGQWLTIRLPVVHAERLLGTKYNVYYHPETDFHVVRTMRYSLPRILHDHVDLVTPTTYFGNTRPMRATYFVESVVHPDVGTFKDIDIVSGAVVPDMCSQITTPACLRALYNTTSYVVQANTTNALGVAGYLDEFPNQADLQTFFGLFRPDALGASYTTVLVNGGQDNQNIPGMEANLDIQYAEAISFPTPNIFYSTGGSPPFVPDSVTPMNTNEPYLEWLTFVLAQNAIPQTLTISYGDDEQTVPPDYANSVCNLFAQIGARGSSVIFSSGDAGVGGGDCRSNDGKNIVKFQPSFPASCPFVTTVGSTSGINPEVATSFSGGGFSDYFTQPSYQSSAVSAFLTTIGDTHAGLFNTSGRGYPDVAAQGRNFQVIIRGLTRSIGGTSASSPTFAGVVSLLNDFRIASGKPSLGFLNPLLYSSGLSGLVDITSGNNPGCDTTGFTAGVGWDPVTGLGTPDFGKLQAAVANLP